jgi:ankyrin repeat protein
MKKAITNPHYAHARDEIDAQQRAAAAKAQGQLALDDALDTAIRFRDTLYAKALLEVGANPNTKDANKASVLGHAISSKHIDSVDLLLLHGADPNLRTGLGTPLTLTIYEQEWDMMRRLLDAGADVNATGTIRATALHVVVKHARDPKLVTLLLQHGANVGAKDAEGLSPLDWAERHRLTRIVRLLKAAARKESGAEKKSRRKKSHAGRMH